MTTREEMKEGQATPRDELERQIMSSLVPKNEREHWAASEIKSLREQLANRDAEIAELKRDIEACPKGWHHSEVVALEKERDQLRDLLRPLAALLQEHNRKGPDDQPIFQINDAVITLGDLRRALATTDITSIPTDI